jgi:arylsulfatase A-like enzyme
MNQPADKIIKNRRHSMRLATLIGTSLVLGCMTLLASASAKANRPNILFILIDDMGWKDLGCAGSSYYSTPHIDRMASEGMRFLNAYSAAPVCTPSRGAIFSGKCPARTQLTTVFNGPAGPDDRLYDKSKGGNGGNQHFEARHRHAMPQSEVSLAKALSDGGYKTGFFGKWHIGECPGYYPDDRGFHVAKGYRKEHGLKYGHFGDRWPKGNFSNLPDPKPTDFIPDVLTDECVDFMTSNQDRPFLAVLSHYIVHTPITPRPDKVEKYRHREGTDQNNPAYAALVESVDDSVGRLLDCIRELGLEDHTLVIFTSDNGGYTPTWTSNYPLMGGKSFPFEAGMKVPMIVRWPGKIRPGTTEERVVGMDIYPTMLAAAGLPLRPEQHVDGLDLMPILARDASLEKRPIVFHYPHYTHATGPFSAIIEDNWKLIRFYNDEHGAYLLYNLAVDPEEQNNLAVQKPDMRDQLAAHLERSLEQMQAEMPVINPDYNPEEKSQRKHLEFTKDLAEKERRLFESRLEKK